MNESQEMTVSESEEWLSIPLLSQFYANQDHYNYQSTVKLSEYWLKYWSITYIHKYIHTYIHTTYLL